MATYPNMGSFWQRPYNRQGWMEAPHFTLLMWSLNVRKLFFKSGFKIIQDIWPSFLPGMNNVWAWCLHCSFQNKVLHLELRRWNRCEIFKLYGRLGKKILIGPWWEISNGMRIHLNLNKRHSKLAMWWKTWHIITTPIEERWSNEI